MSVTIWTGTQTEDDLNMASDSFVTVMETILGWPVYTQDSLYGEVEGVQLLALQERVRIALRVLRATAHDEPVRPAGVYPIFNEQGLFRPGYLAQRLSTLLAVLEMAIEAKQPVRWA